MKYFLPDWEDRIYPNFDFENDYEPQCNKDAYRQSIYAHEIFSKPPYDGLLISLALYDQKHLYFENGKPALRGISDIRKYLRINRAAKPLCVMGDCGAFSYVNEDSPPVTPKHVANLYHHLNFDLGISPDHIIVDSITRNGKTYLLSKREKEKRRKISLDNANEFLRYACKLKMTFTPIGAAQGYDAKSYQDSVNQLLDMGYSYIAIGGLVRYPTPELKSIVDSAMQQVHLRRLDVKVHLLGVLRPELLAYFHAIGVASFDSASFMRKAWLRSTMNYLGIDGEWYAAIRVPQSYRRPVQDAAKSFGISPVRLRHLEQRALTALIDYGRRHLSLESTLSAVMEYDQFLERGSEKLSNLHHRYRETLESRIWERCPCEICRSAGIHVVIFRGANRNKRRGMHNTWTFFQKFHQSSAAGAS